MASRTYRWVKKGHMYVGLLIYAHLALYGIAGLVATFEAEPPGEREPFPSTVETLAFRTSPGSTDKQTADALYALLEPALAGPVPEWALRRDEAGHLRVSFYSVNGPTHVTVLEDAGTVRVERVRNSLPRYLSNLHATTVREWTGDWRLRLWAWMNEVALWGVLTLAISGVYLWLASRPRLRFAIASSAGGAAAFALLWVLIR